MLSGPPHERVGRVPRQHTQVDSVFSAMKTFPRFKSGKRIAELRKCISKFQPTKNEKCNLWRTRAMYRYINVTKYDVRNLYFFHTRKLKHSQCVAQTSNVGFQIDKSDTFHELTFHRAERISC